MFTNNASSRKNTQEWVDLYSYLNLRPAQSFLQTSDKLFLNTRQKRALLRQSYKKLEAPTSRKKPLILQAVSEIAPVKTNSTSEGILTESNNEPDMSTITGKEPECPANKLQKSSPPTISNRSAQPILLQKSSTHPRGRYYSTCHARGRNQLSKQLYPISESVEEN